MVEALGGIIRRVMEQVNGAVDLFRCIARLGQVGGEQILLDVTVGRLVRPIAKIAIVEFVTKQGDHPILRFTFRVHEFPFVPSDF